MSNRTNFTCSLCEDIIIGSNYHSSYCNHKICNECHELSINHLNCNHFKCPVCLQPFRFNEILSEPNRINETRYVDEDGDLIYGIVPLFTYPVSTPDLPLTIEEKYLIYQDLNFKNFYTIKIDISTEHIELDKYYVIIAKTLALSTNIIIGKIDKIINEFTFNLYNCQNINRNTGYISRQFTNPNVIRTIRIRNHNDFLIYKCITN